MSDFRLKVFYTVAKRLNFTKAAAELFITQPAVTKHIHELEKQFGVKLFERNGSRISLTPAGELLLQHATKIFAAYRDMDYEMASLSHRYSGMFRIGASTTIAQYVLPSILAQFNKRYADIRLEMGISNTEQVEQALAADTIDLGVIEGHTKNNLFKYTRFIKDELVLVVKAGHPLVRKQAITINELVKQPLLLREPGSGTLEVLSHALKPKGISLSDLNIEMQLGSTESMKLYIQNADVAAFLSVHSIFHELQQNRFSIIDVNGLSIERYFYFIQKKGQEGGLSELFADFAFSYNFR
ncbi:LysR family transcriptional regulator [Flavobacterium arcticum]|uniref:LysR family transcriptional regulator n=1 Tax=Flavobacterium arcticum TaxID=1784713 RepID=A0A345HEK8_9FLAO|nr:LysR family transcriptional regulator [Flavobacterium arcticum]AXG75018.1 LysR family transcriptional regulator [Flavobacterium arcticum]KAF2506570.1 LysR family transcriptional regulator [Flavobacterium arcticum]